MFFTASSVTVVLAWVWWIAPIAPRWSRPAPVLIVLGLAVWRAIGTGDWGLRPGAFMPALGWSAAFTAIGAVVIYAAGVGLGAVGGGPDAADLGRRVIMLVPWALGQQFALQTVLLGESQRMLSTRGGIVLAALLFGALHLPNPFLAPVTAIAALAWCWIYSRHPNLLPLALSHAALTLAILYALNDAVNLRIGRAY